MVSAKVLGKAVNTVRVFANSNVQWEKPSTMGQVLYLKFALDKSRVGAKVLAFVGNTRWYVYIVTSNNPSMIEFKVREIDFHSGDHYKMIGLRGTPGHYIEQ